VLTALSDALAADRVAHAAIELDALAWTHPPTGHERAVRHLRAQRDLLAEAGHRLLLVTAAVASDDELRAVLLALAADDVLVVALRARPATVLARLTVREPAGWTGRTTLLKHAEGLAAAAPPAGTDLELDTEDAEPADLAERIRRARPRELWRR
jgi:chloramphenicol 3-O-phosphotransferase